MSVPDVQLTMLDGSTSSFEKVANGGAVLVVNVASRCGATPQYAGLEALQQTYGERGLTVLGVPSNQFGGQEPGTNEQIAEFCSTTYGTTFPLTDKSDVNGDDRHPLFAELTQASDAQGYYGNVRWNFEKWLVAPSGEVVGRYSSRARP